jgi:hypothetical protein
MFPLSPYRQNTHREGTEDTEEFASNAEDAEDAEDAEVCRALKTAFSACLRVLCDLCVRRTLPSCPDKVVLAFLYSPFPYEGRGSGG